MQKITSFFWYCAGADQALLAKCPTETSKYVGIGATVFFTGLFAALSGAYALYTVFDSITASVVFGLLWGLMIFNLDRYIVSSMRKEGKTGRELLMATPRLVLAIIISIVIARPLELKIFEKEIQPELIVMEQQKYAQQEKELKARFVSTQDSLEQQVEGLKAEIVSKAKRRDELRYIAQQEADGTGGSKQRNLGPIYKVKKADADQAEKELTALTNTNRQRITILEKIIAGNDSVINGELSTLEHSKINGVAARMEALDRITSESSAMTWAHWFIILLFIAIETAPVFVKLISSQGPYDNLLKIEEHNFTALEIEELAKTNATIKTRSETLPQHERTYINDRLDTELKGS